MIDVPEHDAQIAARAKAEACGAVFRQGRGQRPVGGKELEIGGEFAGAEAGLVKALPALGAPVEDIEVLALAVVGTAAFREFEMGFDEIVDVGEDGCGALNTP